MRYKRLTQPETIKCYNFTPDNDFNIYLRERSYFDYDSQWEWKTYSQNPMPKLKSNPLTYTVYKLRQISPSFHVKLHAYQETMSVPTPDYQMDYNYKKKDSISECYDKDISFEYYNLYPDSMNLVNLELTSFGNKVIEKEEKIYREYVYKNYLNVSETHKKLFQKFAKKNHLEGEDFNLMIDCTKAINSYLEYDAECQNLTLCSDEVSLLMNKTKKGCCRHFASCLVLLLRTLNIPARYVVGETIDGKVNKKNYRYLSDEGHAWVEGYLNGTGWIRLDPTCFPC